MKGVRRYISDLNQRVERLEQSKGGRGSLGPSGSQGPSGAQGCQGPSGAQGSQADIVPSVEFLSSSGNLKRGADISILSAGPTGHNEDKSCGWTSELRSYLSAYRLNGISMVVYDSSVYYGSTYTSSPVVGNNELYSGDGALGTTLPASNASKNSLVLKYDTSGTFKWARILSSLNVNAGPSLSFLASNSSGVYAGGIGSTVPTYFDYQNSSSPGTSIPPCDLWVVKYSHAGAILNVITGTFSVSGLSVRAQSGSAPAQALYMGFSAAGTAPSPWTLTLATYDSGLSLISTNPIAVPAFASSRFFVCKFSNSCALQFCFEPLPPDFSASGSLAADEDHFYLCGPISAPSFSFESKGGTGVYGMSSSPGYAAINNNFNPSALSFSTYPCLFLAKYDSAGQYVSSSQLSTNVQGMSLLPASIKVDKCKLVVAFNSDAPAFRLYGPHSGSGLYPFLGKSLYSLGFSTMLLSYGLDLKLNWGKSISSSSAGFPVSLALQAKHIYVNLFLRNLSFILDNYQRVSLKDPLLYESAVIRYEDCGDCGLYLGHDLLSSVSSISLSQTLIDCDSKGYIASFPTISSMSQKLNEGKETLLTTFSTSSGGGSGNIIQKVCKNTTFYFLLDGTKIKERAIVSNKLKGDTAVVLGSFTCRGSSFSRLVFGADGAVAKLLWNGSKWAISSLSDVKLA